MRSLFVLFFLWSLVGGATTVDRRYIEMPYGPALDERVFASDFRYSRSEFRGEALLGTHSIDLEYLESLNEEFALVWAPFPLGLIIRDPAQTGIEQSACRWSLGLTQGGFWGLRPRFNGYLRRALSDVQAYELELEYFSFFPFKDYPMIWTVGVKANYIRQISRAVAVSIGASVWANDVVLLRTYDLYSSHNTRFDYSVPVRMGFDFRLSPSVHVMLDYEFRGIGLEREFRTHTFAVSPTIRW